MSVKKTTYRKQIAHKQQQHNTRITLTESVINVQCKKYFKSVLTQEMHVSTEQAATGSRSPDSSKIFPLHTTDGCVPVHDGLQDS